MAAAVANCGRPVKRQRLGWDQEISWQNEPAIAAWATIFNYQPPPASTIAALSTKLQPELKLAEPETSLPDRSAAQASTSCRSPPLREDEQDGHYRFELGENLTHRYKIISKMGEGTFGRVLECWDREAREFVAIKVVRNALKYREAAMIEIDVLRVLRNHDEDGSRRCVRLKRFFDYRSHVCMVFEKLGPSLYDFLKDNSYRPFPLTIVREFGRQLLESVAYMHELGLIHTDLKPENVLLVSGDYIRKRNLKDSYHHSTRIPKSCEIRLIDFGSTTFSTHVHSSVVSTRHYRAPEVILGMGWSYACDLWSVACILIELCTGDTLFQTHENLEHLAMMERVLGPIPEPMIRRAAKRAEKYFRHGRHGDRKLNWPLGASSSESVRAVRKLTTLRSIVTDRVRASSASVFMSLLEGMLEYDPSKRLTAKEALKHDFFTQPFL